MDSDQHQISNVVEALNKQFGRGDSALLLAQLTETFFAPEKFIEFCELWNSYSETLEGEPGEADTLEEIYYFAEQAIERARKIVSEKSPSLEQIRFASNVSFATDSLLNVISISPEARKLLNLELGESAENVTGAAPAERENLEIFTGEERKYIEILDRDKAKYVASIRQMSVRNISEKILIFELENLTISKSVRSYLAKSFGLTKTELEILQLVIQRQSVEEISSTRRISLHTVRTHISRIIKKFSAHSITDVALKTVEIISLDGKTINQYDDYWKSGYRMPKSNMIVHLGKGRTIEHGRFGKKNGKPLLILHSLEYGHTPPKKFIKAAEKDGYVIYCPMRPGFGVSSAVSSDEEAISSLMAYIDFFELSDVTLVALSTSAPVGLKLNAQCDAISRLVVVNYAYNAADKIADLKPDWLRGTIDLAIRSKSSLSFGTAAAKIMLQKMGALKFYEKVYAGCAEDLLFVRENLAEMYHASNALLSTNSETLGRDIKTAFGAFEEIDGMSLRDENITTIFGANTHNFPLQKIELETQRLGIPLHVMTGAGRNCAYQFPKEFFGILSGE